MVFDADAVSNIRNFDDVFSGSENNLTKVHGESKSVQHKKYSFAVQLLAIGDKYNVFVVCSALHMDRRKLQLEV